MHRVQKSEALGDPVLQIRLVGLEGLRSADVDRVEIHRWVLVGDPVGERPTDTACRLDSDRVETGGDIAVVDLGGLSHVVDAIGSERLGAVEEQLKADLAQDRHSVDRSLEDRPDMIPVLGQRAEAEITRDLVHTPDLAPRFEEAGHDLPGLLLEVGVVARVAQSRCADLHSLDRFGDDVEVLARLKRDVHTDLGRKVTGPHAGGEHDDLRLNLTLLGDDTSDLAVLGLQLGDGDLLDDRCASGLSAPGERHRGVDRRGLAVAWDVERTDEIVGAHVREPFGGLVDRDLSALDADPIGHRRATADLFPSLLIIGNLDRTGRAVAGGLAGFILELLEQAGRVGRQFGERLCRLELAHQAGGVPRGAGGEGVLLEYHDIGDLATGEVVGDAGADNAAADDDDLGAIGNAGHGGAD